MILDPIIQRGAKCAGSVCLGVCLANLAVVAAARAEQGSSDGFWPTPRMVELLVERVVDDAAITHRLDDRQRGIYRENLAKALPAFFEKHQADLEPVITEIIVQHISGEVPDPPRMARWGGKLLPAWRDFTAKYEEAYQAMRPHL
ncbi:MAG: hypothetical protein JXQ73_23135, partial [Phycisphaerae bacterium]|nr:hypothetical protein [Phycisphaerae bacterium]